MKNLPLFYFLLFFLGRNPGFQSIRTTSLFTDHPALSPDGVTLYFTFAGDIWKVASQGGQASRITAMEGDERLPRISPDGKWLAFSSVQFGNTDVFVLPLEGGEIRQLTFSDASDLVCSWTWDSKSIYFTSNQYNRVSAYKIALTGGTPVRLFPDYHHTTHDIAEHPRTGELFFNESWESFNAIQRKGYKGDHNPDIQSFNPKNNQYKQYTTWEGKDFGATIDRQGNLFFLSDEFNGEYNLYTFSRERKQRLTDFNTAIWNPNVSANGDKVAFRRDYQLYLFDVKTGRTTKPEILIPQNATLSQKQDFKTKDNISMFDVSEDGKKLAFVSRGELFVSDVKGKFVQLIPTRADGRVMEVYWLKDHKTILFNQTVGGYQNWFTIAADGSSPEKQITSDRHNNRFVSFNSDKTKAVYLGGRHELRLLDLGALTSATLLKDEFWDLNSDAPQFGPDDRHIVFAAMRNFERDLLVYDLETQKTTNLTNTGVTEAGPVWSPDGKYIYFYSNRTEPAYPFGVQDADLFRMALKATDAPFRSEKYQALFAQEEKPAANGKDSLKQKTPVQIDLEYLSDRIEPIGPTFGYQDDPYVVQNGEKRR
ncbi:MAG: PD40 domain-containing protein [Haliscomenobacter sp.]|nr:PD40 domain-containing protein [Haliscomenobacter sp.]